MHPNDYAQLPLFGGDDTPEPPPPADDKDESPAPPELELTPAVPISLALEVYLSWLRETGSSRYTVKAFKSDVNLLARWAGPESPVGSFNTADLNRFLHWMLHERDKPCSPKTYARRVTALKNFFGYLVDQDVLRRDPSSAVIQRSVETPLPTVLSDEDAERLLTKADALRNGPTPDARPALLTNLLLQTGIKKAECMALDRDSFLRGGPQAPAVMIEYHKPRMRYKERTIGVDDTLIPLLDEYLRQRNPERGTIFDCTARNLEYVLRDLADMAGVSRDVVNFESLRWTSALSDYRSGVDLEALRIKMGLSSVSWRETSKRLGRLTEKMGYTRTAG